MASDKIYYSVSELQSGVDKLYKDGITKGRDLGFDCLQELYSIKPGCTTYVMGSPTSGKCLGKGTLVIMFDGSKKKVEDIVLGDLLMGDDSTPRKVLSTCFGQEEMFWVRQTNGIDYRVNKSHILSLRKTKVQKKDRKYLKGHIKDISVVDYINSSKNVKRRYKGYKVPIQFEYQNLPIDPYYLGLWLGDGRSAGCDITNIDPEVIDFIRNYAEKINLRFSEYSYKDRCSSYAIVGSKTRSIQSLLKNMGLKNNKHIPHIYIQNSKENRLSLLAGLIDSDGTKDKSQGQYTITQKNKTLLSDIKYLADTLGFRTNFTSIFKKAQTGPVREYFSLTISGNIQEIPVLVERKKLVEYKPTKVNTSIKVEPDGIGEYFGFTIDGNKRFLLEDGTVTHNTEYWFENLINLSEFYGEKHVVYTPETGNKEEIIAELASKYLQKPFYKNFDGFMNDNERYSAMNWLNEHFWIIDPADKDISVGEFYETVDKIEKDYKVKIGTTTIDPYNELNHDMKESGGRQDIYIEKMLGMCRRNAMSKNRHNCIITHCADQLPVTENGITYYPAPTARQYAGGQAWFRKGLGMIGVWRPPLGLCDRDGRPYENNEAHIIIQKAKPKGVGNKGIARMYFDAQRNRYYEQVNGERFYARKNRNNKPAMQASVDFPVARKLADPKEVKNEMPF